MRTVLVGSDFMYNKDGNLVPIEINTNVGWHHSIVENVIDTLDLTDLTSFITGKFTKVVFVGNMLNLSSKISTLCTELQIGYELVPTNSNSITIPYVEDNDETLIIRISYDTTAVVDDTYCRDKVNFLNLIKDSTFSSQFVYKDENGDIINHIASINDNGEHPNFILKSILPQYNKSEYPKFYKVTTEEELNILITNVVTDGYFLMEFHYNPTKLIENNIAIYRGLNLLCPPNLESISIGGYTQLTNQNLIDSVTTHNLTTFEIDSKYRSKYVNNQSFIKRPKLLDTDLVVMADGTFKTAVELEIGDDLRTIDIPNPNNINLSDDTGKFGITYDELITGSTYSTNKIIDKQRVDSIARYMTITFTDNTIWQDTDNSSYLTIRDNQVVFLKIYSLKVGDKIILIDTTDNNLTMVTKEVLSKEITIMMIHGWLIEVERRHIFLTKTSLNNNQSFATIEHNPAELGCDTGWCYSLSRACAQGDCNKGCYCNWNGGTFDQGCDGRTGVGDCLCMDACQN